MTRILLTGATDLLDLIFLKKLKMAIKSLLFKEIIQKKKIKNSKILM